MNSKAFTIAPCGCLCIVIVGLPIPALTIYALVVSFGCDAACSHGRHLWAVVLARLVYAAVMPLLAFAAAVPVAGGDGKNTERYPEEGYSESIRAGGAAAAFGDTEEAAFFGDGAPGAAAVVVVAKDGIIASRALSLLNGAATLVFFILEIIYAQRALEDAPCRAALSNEAQMGPLLPIMALVVAGLDGVHLLLLTCACVGVTVGLFEAQFSDDGAPPLRDDAPRAAVRRGLPIMPGPPFALCEPQFAFGPQLRGLPSSEGRSEGRSDSSSTAEERAKLLMLRTM